MKNDSRSRGPAVSKTNRYYPVWTSANSTGTITSGAIRCREVPPSVALCPGSNWQEFLFEYSVPREKSMGSSPFPPPRDSMFVPESAAHSFIYCRITKCHICIYLSEALLRTLNRENAHRTFWKPTIVSAAHSFIYRRITKCHICIYMSEALLRTQPRECT